MCVLGVGVEIEDHEQFCKHYDEILEELKSKEKQWINYYNSNNPKIGYNETDGGDGSFGYKHSKETK